ncbi:Piwi domain-containing protein [Lacibacter sp.]|uniref:Piwi domain-containing protein n=1 Tax=Lacibacter sp. TaxID=1915409 RepID=UPI002B4B8282|nr:Piwi domain-containing protein [Lacibacter sp.]HLP37088.1 Piwi domain-containing protein [Lacibacter sp.]
MKKIALNFLPFEQQDFGITIFRKIAGAVVDKTKFSYYDFQENGVSKKYEISPVNLEGYEEYRLAQYSQVGLVSKSIYENLFQASKSVRGFFILKPNNDYNRRLHFEIEPHPKGKKCMWIEPYFLKSKKLWGVLVGFQFIVSEDFKANNKVKVDKDILIASGSLNSKGYSNADFYLFKHSYIQAFIKNHIPLINYSLSVKLTSDLQFLEGSVLNQKTYVFKNKGESNSAFLGLNRFGPLQEIPGELFFRFIFLKEDRDYGVRLLKGLRGDTFPSQFSGMSTFFKLSFTNERIEGVTLEDFNNETITEQINEIKESGKNIIPIIITKNRLDAESDRLYYFLKHKFTSAGIACQIVTKELLANDNSVKYSLSNIALQIFSKAGGKPWKMVPASKDYLIIGIGQSYSIEMLETKSIVKKSIAYSVLTDSSGLFKDIQVLSEGVESDDNYYANLANNIIRIINSSGYKQVTIHSPVRLSKSKVFEKVIKKIPLDTELNVLVINNKADLFGFDYDNNGLVPFESTYIKLAKDEFLVWFEGLQYNNPKIAKRYSNPLTIKFWFSSNPNWLSDENLKENLLQDCINLSGANWRGFKSKQLPVSIFYCERIAEFISKFNEYKLGHIEINNLKPWFL